MPAAALGWVTPLIAAIGMSLSSLTVVLNALRITRMKTNGGKDGSRGENKDGASAREMLS